MKAPWHDGLADGMKCYPVEAEEGSSMDVKNARYLIFVLNNIKRTRKG